MMNNDQEIEVLWELRKDYVSEYGPGADFHRKKSIEMEEVEGLLRKMY